MSKEYQACWIDAPAKINLMLEVLGRRPDGYHDIRSILVPVALADRIEIREADRDRLDVESDGVELGAIGPVSGNLATRAVELVRRETGIVQPLAIRIVKRIPIGGGLGGGSSDAAATLVGLNRLWKLDWPRERLMDLGAELGSDVPALVHGGAVCLEGRGERVVSAMAGISGPVPGFTVLLVNPGMAISTGEIFRSCSGELTSGRNSYTITHSSLRRGDLESAATGLFNGLEASVFPKYPAVGRLARQLHASGAVGVLMSGSGSTVFALVKDVEHGERIRRDLLGDYWSRVTWTLPDGVMAAHGFLEP